MGGNQSATSISLEAICVSKNTMEETGVSRDEEGEIYGGVIAGIFVIVMIGGLVTWRLRAHKLVDKRPESLKSSESS